MEWSARLSQGSDHRAMVVRNLFDGNYEAPAAVETVG